MELMIHQLGIFLLAGEATSAQQDPSLVDQVAQLVQGSIPTVILFILLVFAYQMFVQGPLSRALKERRARTEGAMEEAQKAIAKAEERVAEYATKLRQARAEIYKVREQRVKQWSAERDAALDSARRAASQKVSQAKAEIDAEAAQAKRAIEATSGELASRVVRAVLPVAVGGTR